MPAILRRSGVYTHLVSDHYHYWEDGGATYHNRYSSWEAVRGQEGDLWKGEVRDPDIPEHVDIFRSGGSKAANAKNAWRHDWVNRKYMQTEDAQPQSITFELGLEFIETNHDEDNWFLQVETFDPHEPFFTQPEYKQLYDDPYTGPHCDWPKGGWRPEDWPTIDPNIREHLRCEYLALVSMCDAKLGSILDAMDRYRMWDDTMLIVNTDHGFLLGEHDYFAKCNMPWYNEIAHTPLFIWDPQSKQDGQRRRSLVQTIDLAPTLLHHFGINLPPDMQGKPLQGVIESDDPVREAALFGMFGGHVNCTDGRYVYMRGNAGPDNLPLFEYTLMPTQMIGHFSTDRLSDMELAEPLPFTKGARVLRIPARRTPKELGFGTMLFDLETDPDQRRPMHDPEVERRMESLLWALMRENDAPAEQFERLGRWA
jgi:arylsulfatase A-like enzyme